MSQRREIMLIAALAFWAMAVAGLFWVVLPAGYRENQSSDYTHVYEPVAHALLTGQGLRDEGALATRYPPGFSILLAGALAVGRAAGAADETALLLFRMACVGLSVITLYGLARLVWSPPVAAIPAVAWSTYPFFLWLTKQPNSELPFIPFLFAALFLFWLAVLRRPGAWWLYMLAGALAGGAMLIRAAALGLGIALAILIILLSPRRVRLPARLGLAVLLLAGNLLAVLPWTATAYAETGRLIPLSSGGAITMVDGLTFLAVPKEYRREVPVPGDVAALMWNFQERRAEMSGLGGILAVVLDETRAAPGAFLRLVLIKAARSWYGIDSRVFEGPALLIQAVYAVPILWGSGHILFAYRRRRGHSPAAGDSLTAARVMILGNWVIVVYFWAMTMSVVPLLRYMTPSMGVLFVALPGVYLSLKSRRARPALPADDGAAMSRSYPAPGQTD